MPDLSDVEARCEDVLDELQSAFVGLDALVNNVEQLVRDDEIHPGAVHAVTDADGSVKTAIDQLETLEEMLEDGGDE